MNNIYILNKSYKKIGTLSNQGANPQAPYYEDLFIQELETGADTYQFSTMSTPYTQDLLEIGNHIMFTYKNRNELFTITSLEYSHNEGYKTIGVYAEGIGFDLLEIYMKRPENEKESSSSSGGSSSGGGRDEDNDGDDNTDDEYADVDDVYVDENGIIIYDKYGQDDYADPDNVSVDENGVIIYRRNKRNRKKDSLEFKNISYSRFLSILLKNTGWSYVCQPGLESIKHDITVRYDTNIFALLQDSMQSYRGVELEFVHELVGGRVQKVIKAYKDGGRGSFVGKRFEYGKNVRGITKTQEVANSEDDTILYIDNVGVNVQYDVDFALKSAEVPEIEIGDTHYVIDRDFYPPMTIKARIGKIEISFSDPTVNKIYLANNKRISGSAVEDELDEDDIAGIIDDYDIGDDGDEDYVGYHTHDSLKDSSYDYYVYLDRYNFYPATGDRYNLGTESSPWRFLYTEAVESYNCVSSPRYFGYNYQVYYDREDMEDVKKITNSGNITKQDLLNFVINDLNVYEYSAIEVNEKVNADVDDPNARFSNQIYLGLLSDDVVTLGSDGKYKTSKVGARIGKGLVESDTDNDGDQNAEDSTTAHTYNIPALLSCLIGAFQHYVNGGKPNASSSPKDEEYEYEGGGGYNPSDPDNPSNPGGGSYGKLICEELRVERADGSAAQADIFGKLYVTEEIKCELTTETNTLKVNTIKFSDGSTMTTANGSGGSTPGSGNDGNFGTIKCYSIETNLNGGVTTGNIDTLRATIQNDLTLGGRLYFGSITGPSIDTVGSSSGGDYLRIDTNLGEIQDVNKLNFGGSDRTIEGISSIKFADGTTLTTANGSGSGGGTGSGNLDGLIDAVEVDNEYTETGKDIDLHVRKPTYFDGPIYMTGEWNSWGGASNHFYSIYGVGQIEVMIINCDCWRPNDIYKDVTFYGDVIVDGTLTHKGLVNNSDISKKENIRYINNQAVQKENLETRNYSNEDLLGKADLYDFIVNQVNICEYNFIGDTANKIGFIANDYEGTKVGDKIVSKQEFKERNDDGEIIEISESLVYDADNLLFATIGALQEEVRIKDEKIASLEARLAKIEALLDINNDN